MRKLTAGLFMSVDGVVESPNLWQFDSFDDELGAELGALLGRVDTVVMGRVGYEDWSSYWQTVGTDDPFAGFIIPVRKFVASTTLTGQLAWENSELIEGDVATFVRDLKQTDGGEIAVMSSISLVRQLLFAGLLDELTLITHPVVAGVGRHLFEPGHPVTRLELLGSQATGKGNVLLRYRLRAV
jgi:dihydrofolate reductase